jgi:hypothetical protein
MQLFAKSTYQSALFAHGDARRRAESLFADRMMKSKQGPVSEVIELTPELATLLLEKNPDNRRLKEEEIRKMVDDIRAGMFALNGEPIIVSSCGLLNDGQNRCTAVVRAGRSIKTLMVFGVARESRTTVDQGAIRTPGDFLHMKGIPDGNNVAAVASLLWQFETRKTVSRQTAYRPTAAELQEFVDKHPDIIDTVRSVASKNTTIFGGRSILGFCHYLIAKKSGAAAADAFIKSLLNGENLTTGDPVFVARERFVRTRGMPLSEKAEVIFRAWNHQRTGRRVSKIQTSGQLPELEA